MKRRQIIRDFFLRRLRMVGIARKYGMRVGQVEEWIRKYLRGER